MARSLPLVVCLTLSSSILFGNQVFANEQSKKLYVEGLRLLSEEKNDAAMQLFNQANSADPKTADGQVGKAVLYRKTGQLKLAIETIEPVVHSDNSRYAAWAVLADIKYDLRDFAGAIAASSKALELNNKVVSATYTRGMAHLKLGNLPEAIVDFTAVIDQQPQLPNPLVERATAYVADLQYENAERDIDHLATFVEKYPKIFEDVTDLRTEIAYNSVGGPSSVEHDLLTIGRMQRELEAVKAEIPTIEATEAGAKRRAELSDRLSLRVADTKTLLNPNAASVVSYKKELEATAVLLAQNAKAQPLSGEPQGNAEVSSTPFTDKAERAAKAHAATIDELGLPTEVLDSNIIRSVIIGSAPRPWITLRQWIALVIDAGEYKIVEVGNPEAEVWTLALKKPAEPTSTLGFRFDHGDIFAATYEESGQTWMVNTVGAAVRFDAMLFGPVGYGVDESAEFRAAPRE